jgi:hypothetical protein
MYKIKIIVQGKSIWLKRDYANKLVAMGVCDAIANNDIIEVDRVEVWREGRMVFSQSVVVPY